MHDSSSFEYINHRYLLGIEDEPKQFLQPISGYVHEPLLSLEDACEPLLSLVPRLEAHIWVAKQNSKNPADGLTQDESAAIRLYTMEWDPTPNDPRGSLYSHLNQTLKQVDRTKLRPWFRFLKLFLTALAKIPPAPRQTVWRGVRKDQSADYPPGAEVTWWAFSSCTTSLSVLESDLYLGNSGTRTLFSIETINGRTIRGHSHFTTEDEILLLPGTFFEVKSHLNPAPDLYIVHLQQKVPPHPLLDPPFEGAELIPPYEKEEQSRRQTRLTFTTIPIRPKSHRKRYFAVAFLVIIAVLIAIIGSLLGTRAPPSNGEIKSITPMTPREISDFYKNTKPPPVSVADAFYSFDGNTDDFYLQRHGQIIGGSVRYTRGFVTHGQAIVLDQSTPTEIQLTPNFNISKASNITFEGFFMLNRVQMNATLIQLSADIKLGLINDILTIQFGTYSKMAETVISTDQWHHLGFVYDGLQENITLYIDGRIEIWIALKKSILADVDANSSISIGRHFDGSIDQLAMSLRAKTAEEMLWDASVECHYPFDGIWTLDRGPNGLNGTDYEIQMADGWRDNAIRFNRSKARFETDRITTLGTPLKEFSIGVWVRQEGVGGIFLTVANPSTCLLVMGFDPINNRLLTLFPNASGFDESIITNKPIMPSNSWVHVGVTWSPKNRARIYTMIWLQDFSHEVVKLANARGGHSSDPMTITLGNYNGPAKCHGIETLNITQPFIGSVDQFYVFSRELDVPDWEAIVKP